MTERVLILDFGSQYTQLIARRVREQRVYCEIHPCTRAPTTFVRGCGPTGDHPLRRPGLAYDGGEPARRPEAVFELGVPVLGICYGMQTHVRAARRRRRAADRREYGRGDARVADRAAPLFDGLLRRATQRAVWMSHGDQVTALPPGFVALAPATNSPIAAIADEERRFYGVQFHPEVVHTPRGARDPAQLPLRICGLPGRLDDGDLHRRRPSRASASRSGGAGVICGALRRRRLVGRGGARPRGDRRPAHLHLRRQRPAARRARPRRWSTCSAATSTSRCPRRRAPSSSSARSRASTDPEEKRKIIGGTLHRRLRGRGRGSSATSRFLAQGTLYPDVIESVSAKGPAATIKTHHNVGGLPERMNFELIEPLRDLFKDEVRALGRELGPARGRSSGATRSPAPASRSACLGEVTPSGSRCCGRPTRIFLEELRAAGLYDADLAGVRRAAAGARPSA